jgi:hypothetical protein
MMRESGVYDPHILQAIHRIRGNADAIFGAVPDLHAAAGTYKVIALTNNFAKTDVPSSELAFLGWDDGGPTPQHLRDLFDDFCDSSTLGMRYASVCLIEPVNNGSYQSANLNQNFT